MSLQVWMPLTLDLRNLGISTNKATNSGATFLSSGGKLGGCYKSDGGARFTIPTYSWMTLRPENSFSVALWEKGTATSTTTYIFACTAFELRVRNSTIYVGWGEAANEPARYNATISDSTWYHIAFTWDGPTKTLKLYINGTLQGTSNVTGSVPTSISSNLYCTYNGTRYLNDLRIYNHCLTASEVKEISKGLVCHYTLSQNGAVGHNEVVWNGNDGTVDGRTVYRNGRASEKIYLRNKDTYRISGDIKAEDSSSTAYSYPSILPYDVDGLFILNEHTPDGFLSGTSTTLTLQLKSGDTVIYCQNLSAWSTTLTYAYIAAIFGYQDSTGYTYPDMTYTRTIVVFGTTTDKSHINKTNNTITLNSAYSGRTVPAGTTIVLSCYGSTYYYPWSGILRSSVASWTSKSVDLVPANVNRLKWAKYITFSCYSGLYYSNIDIHNITNRIIYDSSGYYRNGTINGNISLCNSPRYKTGIDCSANGKVLTTAFDMSGFTNFYSISWWAKGSSAPMQMMIGFTNGNRMNVMHTLCLNTGDSQSNPFYKPGTTTQISCPSTTEWHHYTLTGDGSSSKLYVDGVHYGTAKYYRAITGTQICINGWDTSNNYNFNGLYSDFRIYATALSADDISDLYKLGALIS